MIQSFNCFVYAKLSEVFAFNCLFVLQKFIHNLWKLIDRVSLQLIVFCPEKCATLASKRQEREKQNQKTETSKSPKTKQNKTKHMKG